MRAASPLETSQYFLNDGSQSLMGEQTSDFYEFGLFRVKSDERVLMRGQDLVSLTPKAFDILLALLENDGRIVPKDDLMKKVGQTPSSKKAT